MWSNVPRMALLTESDLDLGPGFVDACPRFLWVDGYPRVMEFTQHELQLWAFQHISTVPPRLNTESPWSAGEVKTAEVCHCHVLRGSAQRSDAAVHQIDAGRCQVSQQCRLADGDDEIRQQTYDSHLA